MEPAALSADKLSKRKKQVRKWVSSRAVFQAPVKD
jgi:hypothetical protein